MSDDEKQCMLLVMRVLSIVPLNFKVSKRIGQISDEAPLPSGIRFFGR